MRINLYETFCTDTLRSRELARMLAKELSRAGPDESILIDFGGIVFASRSFCHELSTLLKHKKVEYINMNYDVKCMFEALKKPKPTYKIPVEA